MLILDMPPSTEDLILLDGFNLIGNHVLLELNFILLLSDPRLNFQIFALYL
jgi:hypothetical protein